MKKIAVLLAAGLLATTSAFAFDSLITNDTAAVQGAATMKAEAELVYTTASDVFDTEGDSQELADDATQMLIPVKFRYGVMENLEAFGVLNVMQNWDNGATSESGVSDLWLGAKYGVMPEGVLTVRGALLIPLGDEEKGIGYAGGFGIDVAAMTAKQMDAIGLNGQVGLRYAAEDGDSKWQPGIGFYVDAEGSYAFSEVLAAQLGIEAIMIGDGKADGNDADKSAVNSVELNVGACYKLAENMGLKGDFLYNLAGKNTNQYMGVAIAFQYGF